MYNNVDRGRNLGCNWSNALLWNWFTLWDSNVWLWYRSRAPPIAMGYEQALSTSLLEVRYIITYIVNMPILTFASSPGANQSFIIPVFITGFISQYYLFRNKKEWFDKYNYVLSVALDSGMAISTLIVTGLFSIVPAPVTPYSPNGAPDFYCHDGSYNDV